MPQHSLEYVSIAVIVLGNSEQVDLSVGVWSVKVVSMWLICGQHCGWYVVGTGSVCGR